MVYSTMIPLPMMATSSVNQKRSFTIEAVSQKMLITKTLRLLLNQKKGGKVSGKTSLSLSLRQKEKEKANDWIKEQVEMII